jgi:AraC-like DNA-binding protein
MAKPSVDAAIARLSTDAIPERDRLTAWRDFYASKLLRLDWAPRAGPPFRAQISVRRTSELTAYRTRYSPACVRLKRELIGDEDNVTLFASMASYQIGQAGRETELGPGEAALMSNTDVAMVTSVASGHHFGVVLSRAALRPLVGEVGALMVRRIGRDNESLSLLRRYLALLQQNDLSLLAPELRRLTTAYIYDLVALALGATRDAEAVAIKRGVAAARLAALKSDILARLSQSGLSTADLARRHRVSERYVRALFEKEGTTVADFVRERRLERAHRALVDARSLGLTISAIAYEAGFSDLSNFNHAFRRRYGASPSEVRARSKERG